MITALLLIFAPAATWERIFRARRNPGFILITYLLPLVALTSVGEGYGLVHWGKWQSEVTRLVKLTPGQAVVFEVAQSFLSLLLVFIGAKLLKTMGETFHGRHTYAQAFRAVAYGLGPLFLCHLVNAFASISPWFSWGLGMVFSIGVMYQGVPRMMEPDPPHAFGLYFMTSLLLVCISGLITFVTAFYLHGRFPKLDALISGLAARLPF
jgi:Yip1-like protein